MAPPSKPASPEFHPPPLPAMQPTFDASVHAAPVPAWACVVAMVHAVLLCAALTLLGFA